MAESKWKNTSPSMGGGGGGGGFSGLMKGPLRGEFHDVLKGGMGKSTRDRALRPTPGQARAPTDLEGRVPHSGERGSRRAKLGEIPPAVPKRAPGERGSRRLIDAAIKSAQAIEHEMWGMERAVLPQRIPERNITAPLGWTTWCTGPVVKCFSGPAGLSPLHWRIVGDAGMTRDGACSIVNTDPNHCNNSGHLQDTDEFIKGVSAATWALRNTIIYGDKWPGTLQPDNLQDVFWRSPAVAEKPKWLRANRRKVPLVPDASPEMAPPHKAPKVGALPSNRDQHLPKYKRPAQTIPLTEGKKGEIVPGKPTRTIHREVRTMEKKAQWRKNMARLVRGYHAATEWNDFFESLADAIPGKPCSKLPGFQRAVCVMENWDKIDAQQAAINLVLNEIEDRLVARANGLLNQAALNGGPLAYQQTAWLRQALANLP